MINFSSNRELQGKVEQDEDDFKCIFIIFKWCSVSPSGNHLPWRSKGCRTFLCSSSRFIPVRWVSGRRWSSTTGVPGRSCHHPCLTCSHTAICREVRTRSLHSQDLLGATHTLSFITSSELCEITRQACALLLTTVLCECPSVYLPQGGRGEQEATTTLQRGASSLKAGLCTAPP